MDAFISDRAVLKTPRFHKGVRKLAPAIALGLGSVALLDHSSASAVPTQSCNSFSTISALITGGSSCFVGSTSSDLVFTWQGSTNIVTTNHYISITGVGDPDLPDSVNFILSPKSSSSFGIGSYQFSYGLTTSNPLRYLKTTTTNLSSSLNNGSNTAVLSLTTSNSGGATPAPATYSATSPSGSVVNGGFTYNNTTTHSDVFNYTLAVTQGNIQGFTLSTTLDQVPAPLPVFGAVAALGFSRRLRQRIKTAKA